MKRMKYDGYLVHILPTRKCNLQCVYCYSDATYSDYVDEINDFYIDAVARLVNSLPVTVIHIEGGEPMLYEGIYKLIEKLGRKEKVYLVTNGYLINNDNAKRLRQSRLKNVIVSVDYVGSNMCKNKKACINAIDILNQNGFIPEISVTLIKENAKDIYRLFDNAYKHGVRRIRFGEIVRVGAANKNNIMYLDSKDYERVIPEFIQISSEFPEMVSALSLNGNVFDKCSDAFKKEYESKFDKRVCNMSETMITIDDIGEVYTCCNLVGNKNFLIGNIYEPWKTTKEGSAYKTIQGKAWKCCPVGRGYHINIEGGKW